MHYCSLVHTYEKHKVTLSASPLIPNIVKGETLVLIAYISARKHLILSQNGMNLVKNAFILNHAQEDLTQSYGTILNLLGQMSALMSNAPP